MRLIPGRTKVQVELFKGITIADVIVGGIGIGLILLILGSGFENKLYWCIGIVVLFGALLMRMDTEPIYIYLMHLLRHYAYKHDFTDGNDTVPAAKARKMDEIIPYTAINDDMIEYGGKYYGAVLEIPAIEFRFFSRHRRDNTIENGVGRVLRSLDMNLGGSIVKIERPMICDEYVKNEYAKLESLKQAYEQGMLKEDEMKTRVDIIYDRINELNYMNKDSKVIVPAYYLVLYAENKSQLNIQMNDAIETLRVGELNTKRLGDKELAVFLRYINEIDFDEREIKNVDHADYVKWTYPKRVTMTPRKVEINHMITHNFRIVNYPSTVGDAWLASVMSMSGTKVVVKFKPMDSTKSIRGIDRSLQELRGQYAATGVDSKLIEIQDHIETLGSLLSMLKGENEMLLDTNVYVSMYDIDLTKKMKLPGAPERSDRIQIASMKKTVRKLYQENNLRVNGMDFNQVLGFIGGQVSAYDPFAKEGRGMPSNTIGAMYPWIFASVSDKNGFKIGNSDGAPVFIDFFRRDSERVNSNMVIIGKSGSGKSYSTKSLLTNLAADDSKIFILDPENEYTDLAANLHGKFINVGNAQHGRLNPFQIITALDDEDADGPSGSYATHLQFLEEFFKQVLPDCEKDALEYLNSLIDRTYFDKGITPMTDLTLLTPRDYPIFDDLYDEILKDFQQTDNEYIRRMLRTLINYVSKFAGDGRNSNIWNGPSSVTTEENFTVFNFQSLLANRNGTIANAQMLLVLKYIDNEIIKNRDYNTKYGCNRKIIVVIDEAHVFIDAKFPVALDFMFQLAKRIRKYNGMQIVITQNIKDFVGSEELARKSTAIINACQYSFIFALAPNDMSDLCKLYEKAGGINETEQEQIIGAARGQAFAVMSPTSRSTFKIDVPEDVVDLFSNPDYESGYFSDEEGQKDWEEFIGDSREKHEASIKGDKPAISNTNSDFFFIPQKKEGFEFVELSAEEAHAIKRGEELIQQAQEMRAEEERAKEEQAKEAEESDDVPQASQEKLADAMNTLHENIRTENAGEGEYVSARFADMFEKFTDMMESVTRMNNSTIKQMSEAIENVGKVNYDLIMSRLDSIVEEKARTLIGEGVRPEAVALDRAVQPELEHAEQEESVPLGNIFESAAEDSSAYEATEAAGEDDYDLGEELMALTSAFEAASGVSRIDMMTAFGEQNITITLEDLSEYIALHGLK